MAQYRFVHVGAAALLTAGAMTAFTVGQQVFAVSSSASSFVSIVPCRLVDTRPDSEVGSRTTPIGPEETATLSVSGTNGDCIIPTTATSIAANVTVDNATMSSFLTVFPADADRGRTSNVNWQASGTPVANQIIVGLSSTGAINIYNNAGTVDVIIDVSGYYQPSSGGQGIEGQQGATGAPGLKGDQGDTGDTGDTGDQGPQGVPGLQGDQGDPGLKGDTGDAVLAGLECTTGQTISWNDTDGVWACSDPAVDTDTLASLQCTTNQSIGWNGAAWVCKSQPIVATLSRIATGQNLFCCWVMDVFHAYSPNVVPDSPCNDGSCTIRLVDVVDHNSCTASVTGNPYENDVYIWTSYDGIHLENMQYLHSSYPFYVTITCVPDFYPV